MRTRFLSKMVNCEVEEYLKRNDLIFVPVGVTELHGGLPLDAETVVSEGIAALLAEKTDGLILHNLPYFYAGATQSGRGTVQIGIRAGIDYLLAIAKSLYRQGFRRQVYLSLHGPAHMTISPMLREFFEETKCPILYIDTIMTIMKMKPNPLFEAAPDTDTFSEVILAGYDILGRLEDVPLTSEVGDWSEQVPSSVAPYTGKLNPLAWSSGAIGFYFGEVTDHMPTMRIDTPEDRQSAADRGRVIIDKFIDMLDIETIVADMRKLDQWQNEVVIPRYREWM